MNREFSQGRSDLNLLDLEDSISLSRSPKQARLEDRFFNGSEDEGDVEKEMFEAEGQLNLNHCELEQAQDMSSEVEYLRGIWEKLGVGKKGYIVLEELALVCDHIGMEKMDQEELEVLFGKLDSDCDGRVSLDDFIDGLFHHHSNNNHKSRSNSRVGTPRTLTPRALTPRTLTPRASPAQKKLKGPAVVGEDRTTPSVIAVSGASGLFSAIDPDHTGFAMPEIIIDLWEKYNVPNGADILLALGFDLVTRVNLSDLSSALEEEMMNTDEQNAIYHASFVSYQQEIQHLKSLMEQQTWAIEKLRQDLGEANSRNAMLAKEVDERHLHMEQTAEKKLMSIEKKYQDQIRGLQTELDQEREQYSSQAALHKTKLEFDMEELKKEEGKLRTNLVQAQKEMEKLEKELMDATEKLSDNTRHNARLQKELEDVGDMQRKLEEYESTGLFSPEQHKFTQEKLERTLGENKVLKDMTDELTAEVESLKQQIHSKGKSEQKSSNKFYEMGSRIPIREGSFLSDYVKTKRGVRTSVSSENSEDEGLYIPSHPGRVRRRLPTAPEDDDACSVSSVQSDRDYIEILKKEITDLKIHHEREKKDLELSHHSEIQKVEEKAEAEKTELLNKHRKEKEGLLEDSDKKTKAALLEQQNRLKEELAKEKEELRRRYEEEKEALENKHKQEKKEIVEKVQAEFRKDVQAQIQQIKDKHDQEKCEIESRLKYSTDELSALRSEKTEMEENLIFEKEEVETQLEREREELKEELDRTLASTESAIRQLEKEKLEIQVEMNAKLEEMSAEFKKEKANIKEMFEEEIQRLKSQHDSMLSQGESGLHGKLRDDFYALLDRHKATITAEQKDEAFKHLHKEKLSLEKTYADQRKDLGKTFEKEKEEMRRRYEEQMSSLSKQLQSYDNKMEEEREALASRYEEQKSCLEEELATAIREELERHKERQRRMAKQDEFVRQMEVLKVSFESEKHELQEQVRMLQDELEDIYKELNNESTNRKKIDDLNRTINALQKDKLLAEKAQSELQKALQMTTVAMETRIGEINEEKEGAVTAIRTEFMHSAKESGKQKAALDAALRENKCLEDKILQLQQDVSKYKDVAKENSQAHEILSKEHSQTQDQFSKLQQENKDLHRKLTSLERTLEEYKTTAIPPHAQAVIDKYADRNRKLENTIASTQHKLTDVENRVAKLTKQQDDYKASLEDNRKSTSITDTIRSKLDESSDELRKEKEKLMALQLEKARLEGELQKVKDKLMEASQQLSQINSQHRSASPVDIENFTRLQIDLVDQQRQLRELQDFITHKDSEKSKQVKAKEEELKKTIEKLEEEKENLTRKLKLTQEMLDEQLNKLKTHFGECEKKNVLVVDLYKENADLMEALYLMEARKKDAVSRCYRLEDQCRALRLMVKKVCHVTLSR
ncbi:hypothetical protein FSP39_011849 [Pinctada imbricata]|uniref:EF-hand domain-containing protein n=1 Tax=Pinctada imbricata TaxID=66713 RepID=A0AA89BZ82_PINIB|nr:hypothetical protein FSP39_011849 [Pinctada imbricata]